jgi:hypothetical protein
LYVPSKNRIIAGSPLKTSPTTRSVGYYFLVAPIQMAQRFVWAADAEREAAAVEPVREM